MAAAHDENYDEIKTRWCFLVFFWLERLTLTTGTFSWSVGSPTDQLTLQCHRHGHHAATAAFHPRASAR